MQLKLPYIVNLELFMNFDPVEGYSHVHFLLTRYAHDTCMELQLRKCLLNNQINRKRPQVVLNSVKYSLV